MNDYAINPQRIYKRGPLSRPVLERIKERVEIDPVTGCWMWPGDKDRGGYGKINVRVSVSSKGRRTAVAHVVAWEAVNGPRPPGLTLDHVVCERRACVNPAHLVLATQRDNTLRSATSPPAINARKTACPKCGGPYSFRATQRYCRPCEKARSREWYLRVRRREVRW